MTTGETAPIYDTAHEPGGVLSVACGNRRESVCPPCSLVYLRCSAHYRQMITTAWQLGSKRATGEPRFRAWAHMLGYGGHFLTKSRRYSVTFGQLRAARTSYRRAQRHPGGERDPWGRPLDETVVLVLSAWTYAGTGHISATPALSWR